MLNESTPNLSSEIGAGGDAPALRAKPLARQAPIVRLETGLIPARMINEVLYCERLVYLEWVQGEQSPSRS